LIADMRLTWLPPPDISTLPPSLSCAPVTQDIISIPLNASKIPEGSLATLQPPCRACPLPTATTTAREPSLLFLPSICLSAGQEIAEGVSRLFPGHQAKKSLAPFSQGTPAEREVRPYGLIMSCPTLHLRPAQCWSTSWTRAIGATLASLLLVEPRALLLPCL
jgi:hypothetical protein